MYKVIHKVLMTSFILCSFINYGLCQEGRKIVIYANKSDFLIPFIKSTLEEMEDNQTGEKIISNASNLNLLFANTNADKLLRNNLDYNFPEISFSTLTKGHLRDSLLDILINNDYFLLVNENILLDKIEFQLVLYKILRDTIQTRKEGAEFPFKNLIKPIAENDFFINLNSSDHLNVLKNGVKKLLPSSNFLPKFRTTLSGNINNVGLNKYKVSSNDTITISIADIYDEDNNTDQISFRLNISPDNKSNQTSYSINNKTANQFKVRFDSSGSYNLRIQADDGIATTFSDTSYLEVIIIPKIIALKEKYELLYSPNFFTGINNLVVDIPIFIDGKDPNFIFDIEVPHFKKNRKMSIIDSLNKIKILKGRRPYPLFGYSKSVKKDPYGLYIMTIKGIERVVDSSIKIYGITQGLKSNVENIYFKVLSIYPMSVNSGIEFFKLQFSQNKRLLSTYSYTVFNYLNLKAKLLTLKNTSIGISISAGSTLESADINSQITGLKEIKGGVQNLGVFLSKLYYSNSLIFDMDLGLYAKSIPLKFDSSRIYDPKKIYHTYGGEINCSISSVQLKGIGLFGGVGYTTAEYYKVKYENFTFRFGILLNPIYHK